MMIKKILSCILCLSLFSLTALAGVSTPIDINSETKAFDIEGTSSAKNSEVLVVVTRPGVDIAALSAGLIASSAALVSTLTTNADGSFAGQFYLPDNAASGDYTVYVGTEEPVSFYYANSSEIAACISAIQTADVSNIGSRMTYYTKTQKILGLDLDGEYSAYSDGADKMMVDYIKAQSPTQISVIKEYFDKAVEGGILIGAGDSAKIKAAFASNKMELEIDSTVSADSLAAMYLALRDTSVTSRASIARTIRSAAALCRINTATRGEMTDVISDYNDVLGLNLTGDYASLDKIEVNKALTQKGFNSIAAVRDAFSTSVANVKAQSRVPDDNSGKTTGTINVSGGGGSSVASPVTQPVPVLPSVSFNDLGEAQWASDYINALAAKNIIDGVGNDRFDPNGDVTREQFVKMLIGAFGIAASPSGSSFVDVDSSMWYALYVSAACEAGIVSGISDTEFGIGKPISREQMAAMSVRAMNMRGFAPVGGALTFADRAEISSYAYDAVAALYSSGIINGMTDSEFAPKSNLTRAQAAKVIYLIMKAGGYIA